MGNYKVSNRLHLNVTSVRSGGTSTETKKYRRGESHDIDKPSRGCGCQGENPGDIKKESQRAVDGSPRKRKPSKL